MSQLKKIKNRIKSVKNTGKITQAMELVSISKLKKTQKLIDEVKNFIPNVRHLQTLLSFAQKVETEKIQKPEKTIFVVFSSNKGLCGSLNSKVIKELHVQTALKKAENPNYVSQFISIGGKVSDMLLKNFHEDSILFLKDNIQTHVSVISQISHYLRLEIEKSKNIQIVFIGSLFENMLKQTIVSVPVYPYNTLSFYSISKGSGLENFDQNIQESFIDHSKDEAKFFENSAHIYFSLLISYFWNHHNVSEHALRMMAMKNAKDSAKNIQSELSLFYNKTRQSIITQEIAEISSSVMSAE